MQLTYLIHHFLENSADTHPEKECVIHGNQRFTFKEIEAKANSLANYLLDYGIQKGDRIAILLRNSLHYIAAYFGTLKTGAIAVPLNTGVEYSELQQMIEDSSARILISEVFFSKRLQPMLINKRISCIELILLADKKGLLDGLNNVKSLSLIEIYQTFLEERPNISIIDKDIASIIYTSGSTGKSKGVTLTHFNVVSNSRSIVTYLKLTDQDRCMVVLPFYYVYGKSLLHTHFMVSATVIIDNRFTFPNVVLNTMLKEKATGFSGVPSTYSILLTNSSIAKMKFPYLRYLTQAGGHMPSNLKEQLLELFFDKKIFIMYGATEASARLSYLEPSYLPRKLTSIGKAIPNVEIKIFKDNSLEAQVDEVGEIAARGSNIMQGYWNNPEETEKVLQNSWYFTGDLGYKDEGGFFHVTGRKRDMIKVGTYKISAVEVEEILYQYAGVQEVAVIGVPDSILGEAITAVIVTNSDSNVDEADILRFCEMSLPEYKIPKTIVFSNAFPKNESGKILKQKLREDYSLGLLTSQAVDNKSGGLS